MYATVPKKTLLKVYALSFNLFIASLCAKAKTKTNAFNCPSLPGSHVCHMYG